MKKMSIKRKLIVLMIVSIIATIFCLVVSILSYFSGDRIYAAMFTLLSALFVSKFFNACILLIRLNASQHSES